MTTLSAPEFVTVDDNPLVGAQSQLAQAIDILGYSDGLHEMLRRPRRELTVTVRRIATSSTSSSKRSA